jgi:hypothetical protein
VQTPGDDAVAAGHSVDPARWRVLFDELMFGVAGRFARVGLHVSARAQARQSAIPGRRLQARRYPGDPAAQA